MLHTNNGGAKIEQPIATDNLSIFGMPTRAKTYIPAPDWYKNAGYKMGNSINPVWQYNVLAPTYFAASAIAFKGILVPYSDQW